MTARLLLHLLLDLAVIVAVARIMGAVARRLGQPEVIGQIIGGILLGPSLLGTGLVAALFPSAVLPSLTTLADVGICVFMFLVGIEFDRGLLRGQGRIAVTVSVTAVAVPFAFGTLLALYLYNGHPTVHRLGSVLFLGTALSVTAFPVLARILADRGFIRTTIGGLALASAAVGDVLAWTLLAVATVLSGSGHGGWRVLLVVPFAALLEVAVRPLLARWAAREMPDAVVLLAIAAGLLCASEATAWMGLQPLFGAFLLGTAMPGAAAVPERAARWIERVSSAVLLPVFFMIAGLHVNLSRLNGAAFSDLGLILLVAIGGKIVGTFVGARLTGLQVRHSAVMAILMNTRGLTELIVLAVGVQIGVLDPQLYSLMVVMAVVTTAMTGVLLRLVYPAERMRQDMTALDHVPGTAEESETWPRM